jgi:hypothetical protein
MIGLLGKAELGSAQWCQVDLSAPSCEVYFEIVRREVRWSFAGKKSGRLLCQVGRVLGTSGRGRDVHDVAIAISPVLILNRMHHVRVPEHRSVRFYGSHLGNTDDRSQSDQRYRQSDRQSFSHRRCSFKPWH